MARAFRGGAIGVYPLPTSETIRMHARELRWSLIVALAAFTVACADNSIAPTSDKAQVLPGGAPNFLITVDDMAEDNSSADFTVMPSGGYFQMGRHGIVFP